MTTERCSIQCGAWLYNTYCSLCGLYVPSSQPIPSEDGSKNYQNLLKDDDNRRRAAAAAKLSPEERALLGVQ